MSAPAVMLSGYLATIAMHGAETADVVELQSRVELNTRAVRAHAAQTVDVGVTGLGASAALRDASAGATLALGAVSIGGELHVLDTARDGRIGHAAHLGVAAHAGTYVLAIGGGRVAAANGTGNQLAFEVARPRLAPGIGAAALLVITGAGVSAGGKLDVHASRRADLTLEALAGARSRALLSHGETLEALSGTQHELVRAGVTYSVGRGAVVFAAASLRRDISADDRDVLVISALAGSTTTF